jgi:hypothetical protein
VRVDVKSGYGRAVLYAAVGAALVVIAQSIVNGAINAIAAASQAGSGIAGVLGGNIALNLFTQDFPVAAGIFVTFMFLLPIEPSFRIARVILRSLVATAVVALGLLVTAFIVAVFATAGDAFFGHSFPINGAQGFFQSIVYSVAGALTGAVNFAPLVVLAGVLLWLWLKMSARS